MVIKNGNKNDNENDNDNDNVNNFSIINIEVIKAVLFFSYKRYFKHLKHK